jgi:predicted acylesterase/phospholipase RssA
VKREREFEGIAKGTALPGEAYFAISGGGQDGAYGAGMLCGWTDRGDRPHFRIVTGVSAGALIAPFVFAGSEYDSVLREIFTSVHTKDIARSRNLLSALTGEALYDSDPLRDMLKKHVNQAMLAKVAAEYRKGRNLFVATTNLDAQRPVIWALGKIAASGHPDAPQLFREVMLASASIPGIFPPVYVETQVGDKTYEEMHVDGGATSQVFLYPPTFDFRSFASDAGALKIAQCTSFAIVLHPRRINL